MASREDFLSQWADQWTGLCLRAFRDARNVTSIETSELTEVGRCTIRQIRDLHELLGRMHDAKEKEIAQAVEAALKAQAAKMNGVPTPRR